MRKTGNIGLIDWMSCTECRRYDPTTYECRIDPNERHDKIKVDTYLEKVTCGYFKSIHEPDPEHNPNQMELFPELDKVKS